eukprot:11865548-Alexandrium_andersonii.AAC.1
MLCSHGDSLFRPGRHALRCLGETGYSVVRHSPAARPARSAANSSARCAKAKYSEKAHKRM